MLSSQGIVVKCTAAIFFRTVDWKQRENIVGCASLDYQQSLIPSLVRCASENKSAPSENWEREARVPLIPSFPEEPVYFSR